MNGKPIRTVEREMLVAMLAGALDCGELRFARQASLTWLAAFPGDLEVRLLQARVLLADGHVAQSVQTIEQVIRKAPTFPMAYHLLADICRENDPPQFGQAITALYGLGEKYYSTGILGWGDALRSARQAVEERRYEDASRLIPAMLRKAPDLPLAASVHLRWALLTQQPSVVSQLATMYRNRWPDCLPVNMILAAVQMELGSEQEGVRLMYQCAANDTQGLVAEWLWGEIHPFVSLWPEELVIPFDLPVPAGVAVRLGWNQLEAGDSPVFSGGWNARASGGESLLSLLNDLRNPDIEDIQAQPSVSEAQGAPIPQVQADHNLSAQDDTEQVAAQGGESNEKCVSQEQVRKAEVAFERLAKQLKRPSLAREDGRYPVYVLFSTKTGLEKEYGEHTAGIIGQELARLASLISNRLGWASLVFYPDDPACAAKYSTQPASASDPWKLKLALVDLDRALARRGEMIGCVLIVGGDHVVPFHNLPNPTDDMDREVPSDSPYATSDANYFVPEWPVGRLPGEPGPDAGFLLEQLRRIQRYHARQRQKEAAKAGMFRWLVNFWGSWGISNQNHSLGYTAAVWRRSSMAVFRPIGAPHTILTSPPENSSSLHLDRIMESSLGYYNLHGTEDSAMWFGQRDPADKPSGPDYPVALKPDDLRRNSKSPHMIFSEACYGGDIFNKNENTSMALKFLAVGARAVVVSTCIAYGSVTTPLISADLLGSLFWKNLKLGRMAGEALFQARIDLAREMDRRQGYLDGEDQKALISFVLLGDPLAAYDGFHSNGKTSRRLKDHFVIPAVSAKELAPEQPASEEVVNRVKELAAEYLPGAGLDFDIHYALQNAGGNEAPVKGNGKGKASQVDGHWVVTVSKQVRVAKQIHRHYLRLTLNDSGDPVKVAISR